MKSSGSGRGEMIDEQHFLRRSVNLDALDLEFVICEVDGEILVVNFFHLRGFFFANAAEDGVMRAMTSFVSKGFTT